MLCRLNNQTSLRQKIKFLLSNLVTISTCFLFASFNSLKVWPRCNILICLHFPVLTRSIHIQMGYPFVYAPRVAQYIISHVLHNLEGVQEGDKCLPECYTGPVSLIVNTEWELFFYTFIVIYFIWGKRKVQLIKYKSAAAATIDLLYNIRIHKTITITRALCHSIICLSQNISHFFLRFRKCYELLRFVYMSHQIVTVPVKFQCVSDVKVMGTLAGRIPFLPWKGLTPTATDWHNDKLQQARLQHV